MHWCYHFTKWISHSHVVFSQKICLILAAWAKEDVQKVIYLMYAESRVIFKGCIFEIHFIKAKMNEEVVLVYKKFLLMFV